MMRWLLYGCHRVRTGEAGLPRHKLNSNTHTFRREGRRIRNDEGGRQCTVRLQLDALPKPPL